jgi:Zn-dependent M28 family amino/carboxypeptidase
VARLAEEDVAGILVARRPPPKKPGAKESARATEPLPLGFRYTWAFFVGQRPDPPARDTVPMIEVSSACATALLGEDVEELAQKIDRAARPVKHKVEGRTVSFRTRLEDKSVRMDNVVGVVPGTDPLLASQWVIVGAHYDHIGVGPRGLVGYGADDNGSGTAALIEILEAMAAAPPRRSVLFAAFAAEEDGLIGSQKLAKELPFAKEAVVAMLNLDMIGRGEDDVAMVLGIQYNPDLERVLDRAKKLEKTGIKTIEHNSDGELFQRSDQYSFHQIGVPTVFFMEDLPLATNTQYHTWKDVVDLVDTEKIANTAKLAFNTAWILATDDERPSAPRE